jgi:DNA repair exonuclease SbcCD ATPase subunit
MTTMEKEFGAREHGRGTQPKGEATVDPKADQINELKLQNHFLSEQLKKVVDSMNELIKHTNVKFDRVHQSVQRLEQTHNAMADETGVKFAHMTQKVAERRTLDAKVQEMVDRHNNVLKTYEVRMQQLQRLLSEKEAQVIGAHAALNEVKMDIARLKRM